MLRWPDGPVHANIDCDKGGYDMSGTGVHPVSGLTGATLPAGSSYLVVQSGILAAGATLTARLEFTNPTQAAITYTTRVLTGPGAR